MLQSVDEGSVVVSGVELLILARLVHAGLPALERRDGASSEVFRAVAADVCRQAETVRRRIEREARRSKRVSETKRAPCGFPDPSSAPVGAYLRTSEASAVYGVSQQYLRRLASRKIVATVKGRAGEYWFDAQALAAWSARRANENADLAH